MICCCTLTTFSPCQHAGGWNTCWAYLAGAPPLVPLLLRWGHQLGRTSPSHFIQWTGTFVWCLHCQNLRSYAGPKPASVVVMLKLASAESWHWLPSIFNLTTFRHEILNFSGISVTKEVAIAFGCITNFDSCDSRNLWPVRALKCNTNWWHFVPLIHTCKTHCTRHTDRKRSKRMGCGGLTYKTIDGGSLMRNILHTASQFSVEDPDMFWGI